LPSERKKPVASGNKNSPETQDSKTSPETTTAASPEKIRRRMTREEIRAATDRTRHIFTPERRAEITRKVIEASRKAREHSEEFLRRMMEDAERKKQE
jgi:hypothetical protein